MKLRTEIELTHLVERMHYKDKIFFIGSCFSVSIAELMRQLQYQVLSNPAGITFNPVSIAHTIKSIIRNDSLPAEDLLHNQGIWSHCDFHSQFSGLHKYNVIDKINSSLQNARQFLKESSFVVITLGTSWVYETKNSGHIVNNCHKLPSETFVRRMLSTTEIHNSLEEAIKLLLEWNPHIKRIIFTLSPVRHIKDGLHENQLSKASCLLAIDKMVHNFTLCDYFPSYELMVDDLRDYRFYNDDLIHPTSKAVSYIFQCFEKYALDEAQSDVRHKVNKIQRALEHKPHFPESEAHMQFMERTHKMIAELQSEFDFMRFATKPL